jgi:drug/metabolite transporter (DMT)-like permease
MGILFSLSCALTWGFAVVLLKHSAEKVDPLALNLYRVVITTPLLILTALVARVPLWPHASTADLIRLAASAVLGIVVADTLFHTALRLVGAGITAIVDSLYSPMTVLFAFLLLGERITARDFAGMGLIVSGLLLTSTLHPPPNRTRAQLLEGIGMGLAAIVILALAIVIAKPALNRLPVLWAAAFRQGVSAVVLCAVAAVSPRRRELFAVLKPSSTWKVMFPGTLLGSYLSLTLWIAGMKYTLASIAAILTQSSTAWILLFSVLFLKEPFTRRKAAAAILALSGVALVSIR